MAYVTYLLLSGMLGSSRQDETISPVKSSRLEYVPAVNSILHAPIRQLDENARLPEHFCVRLNPTPVAAPRLVKVNVELARELGLDADALANEQGVEILAGNRVAEGAEPVALAYAGHQFGHFVAQLGDGRANLLGEVVGGTACVTTSNSRVPAGLLSRAGETAEPRWGRYCVSTL